MDNEYEKYFLKRYDAYITSTISTFHRVQGTMPVPSSIGTHQNRLYGPLQVIEEPGVQVTMNRREFEKICRKLYELDHEEMMRSRDTQLYELWLKYRMWMDLKR